LAARLSSPADLDEMDRLAGRYGGWILIATRALPVLAEAAVLLLGTTKWSWRVFLPAVAVSNLGIALVYSALGHFATSYGELPLALVASIALPLAAAFLARRLLASRAVSLGAESIVDPEPLSNEPTSL
jgi:membrane protein DedA with SNARE-associated domain